MTMEYTGERLIPGRKGLELLELEHRARYELVVPSARGKRVLDLGCGTGYGANRLAEVARRVVGIDVSAESVEYARSAFARPDLTFEIGDLSRDEVVEELRHLEPEPFEVMTCFEVIEHVPDPVRVLARIKRLLDPGGLLFLSTPNIARPQAVVERDNPFHLVEYGEEELLGVLRAQFSSVRLFRQSVHLGSRIVPDADGRPREVSWRDAGPAEAKYWVAVCSDLAGDEAPVAGLDLSTSDAHLMLLQERLAELRKDQRQRGQTIEELRARMVDQEASRKALELWDAQERALDELRRERDGGVATIEGLRRSEAELATKVRREETARAELERRAGKRELELQANAERLGELQQQVEQRTAAGLELAREVEELREALASESAELEAERRRAGELEREVESMSPPADPAFMRHFADLSARAEERASQLLRRNAELERQNVRLIEELEARGEENRLQAGEVPLTLGALHREIATWKRLAHDLASELYHVLTSRRWRFAMRLVRLRNFLLRLAEGDPIGGHLNRHLRQAGQDPGSFEIRVADARRSRRAFLSHRLPGAGKDMQLLGEEEKRAAAEALSAGCQDTLASVVMPTWNRGDQIAEAIRSVLAQSYATWELLIVDDGSTDDTAGVVERLAGGDERIRYLPVPHGGVSAARDAGLQAARGELIAYLDSDNAWDPDYLLFMVNAIRDSGRMCAYAALRVTDYDQEKTVTFRHRRFDYEALLKNNYIDINVFVHRAELFRELGGFDRELRRWVDWDLILRYVRNHPPEEVPVVLCDYKRDKRSCQITLEEPSSYKHKVLNKHLIDWEAQGRGLERRKPGLVSVVIPNYDLPEMTETCVESILAAGGPELEIVVVDNGSSPRNRRKLRNRLRQHESVRLVENYENYGFSLGCNLGAAAARGEFVVWLNNDTEVRPGWVEPLIRPLREDPTVGMVGAKLLWPDGTLQHGGMVFGPRSKIPYHIYQGFPGDHPAANKRRRFRVLTGACLAVRAADFVELEGFDPLYRNGGEDVDFCLRMETILGKGGLYDPSSVAIHHEGQTEGRSANIQFNRKLLVARWGDRIEADDQHYFDEDGFVVLRYIKKGAERDGETALYHPQLALRTGGVAEPSQAVAEDLLRVGFVSIWYERGISYHTRQLVNGLEQTLGFECHIFARWESARFRNAGSIFHPRVINAGDDPEPAEAVAWARDRQLDVVIFLEIHPNDWKRVVALRAAGFKVLCYENLDILRLDMLDRYEEVDGFLANSLFGWQMWRSEMPGKPVLALPWGIPPQLVPSRARRNDSGEIRFVHVAGWGGIHQRKNTGLTIEAFHQAAPPRARLRIFSQSPLASYGAACEAIVRRDPAIEVEVGTLESIWDVYVDADVLLLPSKREGLGLPIVEALASGLPVLISDGWMMKEWPVLGEHAIACRAKGRESESMPRYLPLLEVDRDDLVEKIRELASSSQQLAAMTAAVARDRSSWLWTWQPAVFAAELRRFILEGNFHTDPAAYIPAFMLDFERRRAASRGEQVGGAATENGAVAIASAVSSL